MYLQTHIYPQSEGTILPCCLTYVSKQDINAIHEASYGVFLWQGGYG